MQRCYVWPAKHRSCEKLGFMNFYIPYNAAIVPWSHWAQISSLAPFHETRLVQKPGAENCKVSSGHCDHHPIWSCALFCILTKGKRQLSRKRGASPAVPWCGSKLIGKWISANSTPIGPRRIILILSKCQDVELFWHRVYHNQSTMFQWEINKRIVIHTPCPNKSMHQLFKVFRHLWPNSCAPARFIEGTWLTLHTKNVNKPNSDETSFVRFKF